MRKGIQNWKGKLRLTHFINLIAIVLMTYSINTTCLWLHHQPEVPEAAKKFRKF